jgi:hypothetical protein
MHIGMGRITSRTIECSSDVLSAAVERAACLSARNDEIVAIHVVPGRRPNYKELAAFRRITDARSLHLSLDGNGALTIRRPRTKTIAAPDISPHQDRVPVRAESTV